MYQNDGNGRIWLMCTWEFGPICYGLALDLIGAIFFVVFLVFTIGISFFGWFGIKPKLIRRKLHDN